MTTRKSGIAQQGAATSGSEEGKLLGLGDGVHLLWMARTNDRECGPYLVAVLHLVENGGPCRILTQVSSVPEHVETVFRPGKRHVDTIRTLYVKNQDSSRAEQCRCGIHL